jgi:hypothetical protein
VSLNVLHGFIPQKIELYKKEEVKHEETRKEHRILVGRSQGRISNKVLRTEGRIPLKLILKGYWDLGTWTGLLLRTEISG